MRTLEIVEAIDSVIDQTLSLSVGRIQPVGIAAHHLALNADAVEGFRTQCRSLREWFSNADQAPYAATSELDEGQYFLLDDPESMAELKPLRALAGPLGTQTSISPADLDTVVGVYGVTLANDSGERLTFIKRANPVVRPRSGKFFAIARERLSKLDGPLFAFSLGFDLLLGSSWAAVIDQTQFEKLFKEAGLVNRHIASWISGITDHIPMTLADQGALTDVARRDSRTWRRLRDIKRSGHLKDVTLQQIVEYAVLMGIDADQIVRNGQLVFDPKHRFSFLHLLNEDLYVGPLTGQSFESHRKSSV